MANGDVKPTNGNGRAPLTGLFIFASIAALYFGRDLILPVLMAFLIAIAFRPAVRYLARRHVPPWLTATGIMGVVVAAGLLAIYFLIEPISNWIVEAPAYAQAFAQKLKGIRASFESFIALTERLETVAAPTDAKPVQEVVVRQSALMTYIGQITGYSAGLATTFILTLVIAGFLMASGDLFYAKLVRVMPRLADKKRALRIVYDVEREVSAYLLTVTAINALLGVAVGVSFHALGMPMPYMWGILAFVFNFVPYVGAVAAIALSGFMAVVIFDSIGQALLLPLAYAFWNFIENQFVTPLFLGRRLQLNSVAILLAMAFWTWLWGIPGTIMAVPLLVTFKVFCDRLESLQGVGEFLSEKYPEDREAEPAETKAEAVQTTLKR